MKEILFKKGNVSFWAGVCECETGFGVKISQQLISIQPHLFVCLVVAWLLMCD